MPQKVFCVLSLHLRLKFCRYAFLLYNSLKQFDHLTAAAGVAGFIKTVLALYNQKLPPSIGFTKPNPIIDFKNSPFYVNTQLTNWPGQAARIAGVSSFGVGGTNVHIIAQEFENQKNNSGTGKPRSLITWSSKNEKSQFAFRQKLGNFLSGNSS